MDNQTELGPPVALLSPVPPPPTAPSLAEAAGKGSTLHHDPYTLNPRSYTLKHRPSDLVPKLNPGLLIPNSYPLVS